MAEDEELSVETASDLSGDPALTSLVYTVELVSFTQEGVSIGLPLTLIVGGATVTGTLTAARVWWPGMEDRYRAMTAAPGTDPDAAAIFTAAMADATHSVWGQVFAEEPEFSKIDYLHLSGARVVHAQGLVPQLEGLAMRIRLSDVQGWSIGLLSPS
ncbi:MAG TPA: hypothetical protein VHU85_17900 [Acidimicrobiales bacterium]|nr:hypothetical protein [Acidimicrobiales bacterium]